MKRFGQLEFRLRKKVTILVLSVFMVTLFLLHQSLRESKSSRREAVFRSEFLSAVETTNQYTGSNMSDRQLTADLHYRTAVVLKDARHSL